MAKQRYINTHFWDDGFIVDLEPIDKLLFLYFLTNPLTNVAGAYEISLRRVVFDTGISKETVLEILKRFESENKIFYRDGWVLVLNFIKNQSLNPKIITGIQESVKHCPDWIKHRLSIAYDSLSHLNSNSNRDFNSIPSNDGQGEPVAPDADKQKGDPVLRRIWQDGVELLKEGGKPEKEARSLLGGLAKKYSKTLLAECIAVTQASNPVNPDEFLIKCLENRNGTNASKNGQRTNNGSGYNGKDSAETLANIRRLKRQPTNL